jgi:hypothetical protein
MPFVLFVSFGVHTHPPPPPTKTPRQIQQDIIALIQQQDTATLTTGKV